jgi:hypothetical protein
VRIQYPEDDLLPDFLINSMFTNESTWGDLVHSSQDGIVENVTSISQIRDYSIEVIISSTEIVVKVIINIVCGT